MVGFKARTRLLAGSSMVSLVCWFCVESTCLGISLYLVKLQIHLTLIKHAFISLIIPWGSLGPVHLSRGLVRFASCGQVWSELATLNSGIWQCIKHSLNFEV